MSEDLKFCCCTVLFSTGLISAAAKIPPKESIPDVRSQAQLAPPLSSIAHTFTVFAVSKVRNNLAIIFDTTRLRAAIKSKRSDASVPR